MQEVYLSIGDMLIRYIKHLKHRKNALLIFFLLAFTYGYFSHDPSWNGNSRLGLIFAIVQENRLAIDSFHTRKGLKTEDKAFHNGHYYSDKAVGTALLGSLVYLPIYGVARLLHYEPSLQLLKYLLTFLVIGIPSAFAGSLLYVLCEDISGSPLHAYTATLAIAMGTMCLPYSTLFYGHQLAASLLFCAFFLIFQLKAPVQGPGNERSSNGRLFLIGFLLGFSLITEYPTILIVIPLIAYCFYVLSFNVSRHGKTGAQDQSGYGRSMRYGAALVMPLLGGAIPLIILATYNTLCFGSPLSLGYQHEALEGFRGPMSKGVLGVAWPSPRVLYYITVHPAHGLFWLSPVLLLSLLGASLMLANKGRSRDLTRNYRAEAILCLVTFIAFLLFNAGYYAWWGGWAFGPRHLIPALPLLGLALIFIPKRLFPLVAVLCAFSIFQMMIVTADQPQIPDTITPHLEQLSYFEYSPIYSHSWQRLTQGKYAMNAGRRVLRLRGFASLLPLILVVAITTAIFINLNHRSTDSVSGFFRQET